MWFRCHQCTQVFLVVDDVRHAYGSTINDVIHCLLWKAGFLGEVIDLLLMASTRVATTSVTGHMGGYDGVVETLSCLLAGVGCLVSAMVFSIVAEIHAFLALLHVP